jgi:hypothetical protein
MVLLLVVLLGYRLVLLLLVLVLVVLQAGTSAAAAVSQSPRSCCLEFGFFLAPSSMICFLHVKQIRISQIAPRSALALTWICKSKNECSLNPPLMFLMRIALR